MTLQKAIEILEEEMAGMAQAGGGDWDDAILLGIEALKWRHHCQRVATPAKYLLLPGETEK